MAKKCLLPVDEVKIWLAHWRKGKLTFFKVQRNGWVDDVRATVNSVLIWVDNVRAKQCINIVEINIVLFELFCFLLSRVPGCVF